MAQYSARIKANESFQETFVYRLDGQPVDLTDALIFSQFRDRNNTLVLDASLSSGHIFLTGNPGEFEMYIRLAELKLSFNEGEDYYFDVVVRTGVSPDYHYVNLFDGSLKRSGGYTVIP